MNIQTFQLRPENPKVTLTAYIIDESQELLKGKKRPGILICPGGAYLFCSDREAEPVALRFAAMGYHAFVLRYSVYYDQFTDFDAIAKETHPPIKEDRQHPAPMHDIAQAMTLIHDHQDEWGIDCDKLILCGFSAGGHNVLNYAVHYHQPIITDHYPLDKIKPAAVITGYPVVDYTFLEEANKAMDPSAQPLFEFASLAFLGTKTPTHEQLLAISPNHHITKDTPPMFIWSTAQDSLVHIGNSTRLATALADKGVPFELHIYEEGVHGLALANQATSRVPQTIDPIAAGWIDAVEKWLHKRFALNLN